MPKIIDSDASTDLAVLEISSKGVDKVVVSETPQNCDADKKNRDREPSRLFNFQDGYRRYYHQWCQPAPLSLTSEGNWDMNAFLQQMRRSTLETAAGLSSTAEWQVIGINSSLKISQSGVESLASRFRATMFSRSSPAWKKGKWNGLSSACK